MAKAAVQINIVGALNAQALKQAQRELDTLGKKAEGAGSRFSRISGAAAPVGAALKRALLPLSVFGVLSVKAFGEAEEASAKLASTLERSPKLAGETAASFEKVAKAIQAKTRADDESVITAAAVLGQFELTGDQIRELLPLVVDYARKTGQDTPAAAETLGKAMLGNARALKAIGVNFKSTGDRGKDFAGITDVLRAKVGGFAEKEGKTTLGRLEIMKNRFNDLQEVVGGKLVGAFDFLARNMAVVGPILAGITAGFVAFKIAALAAQVVSLATGTTMAVAFGPIGLIIAAVVAVVVGLGFVIFRFRDQIGGALGAVGRFFTRTFSGVVRFLKQWGPVILAVLTGPIGLVILAFTKFRDKTFAVFRTVKDFILGIFNGIKGGLIAAMNWVIDNVINRMIEVANKVIRAINKLPGPNLPLIPRVGRIGGGAERGPTAAEVTGVAGGRVTEFQRGGRVLGPVGAPQLAIVHGGEDILTAAERGRRGGGTTLTVIVNVEGSVTADRDLAATVRDELLRMRRRLPDLRLA